MGLQSESKNTLLLQQDVRQTKTREKRVQMMTFNGLQLLSSISRMPCRQVPQRNTSLGCTVLKFPWGPNLCVPVGS